MQFVQAAVYWRGAGPDTLHRALHLCPLINLFSATSSRILDLVNHLSL
jgi:hypothetical protein